MEKQLFFRAATAGLGSIGLISRKETEVLFATLH